MNALHIDTLDMSKLKLDPSCSTSSCTRLDGSNVVENIMELNYDIYKTDINNL